MSVIAAQEWKDIAGWEGLYAVSSHGQVKSYDRLITESNGKTRTHKGRLVTLKKTGRYHGVSLFLHGAEFVDVEQHAMPPHSLLTKKHRARRIPLDPERHRQQHHRYQHRHLRQYHRLVGLGYGQSKA